LFCVFLIKLKPQLYPRIPKIAYVICDDDTFQYNFEWCALAHILGTYIVLVFIDMLSP